LKKEECPLTGVNRKLLFVLIVKKRNVCITRSTRKSTNWRKKNRGRGRGTLLPTFQGAWDGWRHRAAKRGRVAAYGT